MSSISDTPQDKCVKCGIHAKKTVGPKKIINDSFVCPKCYSRYSFSAVEEKKRNELQNLPTIQEQQLDSQELISSTPASQSSSGSVVEYNITVKPEIEYIELPFRRPISTHDYCFLCGKRSGYTNVPSEARKQVFVQTRIFIPKGNRCCPSHLLKKRLYEDEIKNIRVVSSTSRIEVEEVTKLMDSLSVSCDRELTDQISDFTLSEERLLAFTGLNWEQLLELREMMTSMRSSEKRNVTQAIVVFLFRLRTGNSNKIIASVLGLERPQQVSDFSESVLKAFEQDVLPTRFGIQSAKRNVLIENTAPITRELYDINNELALVCDGTYLRHQKSTNNEYQRKSYSGQKKVPLCKPFTICTTNGYIVDIMGPYYATQNDALIMKEIMSDDNGLVQILNEGDLFFVDRGFRDVASFLEEKNYKVLMPALKGKQKQLTAAESNSSRRVTIIRWVVEAVHGVIGMKYQLLHQQFDNKMIPNAGLYCRIAGFLVNQFGKRYVSTHSTKETVLSQIRRKEQEENTLAIEAETQRWSRRKIPFKKMTSSDVMDFPELTEEDLKVFFTGTYQFQQAVSYLAEMTNAENEIDLHYLIETPDIIKVQVRSRHISRKTYNCFINYKPNSIGYEGILRYCCECANGLRTIGCCSHVAAIIYYLSHARFQSKI